MGMKTVPGTELEAAEAAVHLVSGTERARTAVARDGHETADIEAGQILSGTGAHP